MRTVKCPIYWGRAMALAPDLRLLIAEDLSRSNAGPRGICGGEYGPGMGLASGASDFSYRYSTTNASYSHFIHLPPTLCNLSN